MLKIALQHLITKYGNRFLGLLREDSRIAWLKKFLNTREILLRSDGEDIAFYEFCHYITEQSHNKEKPPYPFFPVDFFTHSKKTPVEILFDQFARAEKKIVFHHNVEHLQEFKIKDAQKKEEKEKKEYKEIKNKQVSIKYSQPQEKNISFFSHYNPTPDTSLLSRLPTELHKILTGFLDPKEITVLSTCSFFYWLEMQKIDYWINILLAMHCDSGVLDEIIHTQAIQDYRKLYKSLFSMSSSFRNNLPAWVFYCLSGSPCAIQYAIDNLGLTKETKDTYSGNALHYAIQSSSITAAQFCINNLKSNIDSVDFDGGNLLHYAAIRGSIEAMIFCIRTLKIKPSSVDNRCVNALLFAAHSGSVIAMQFCIAALGLNPESIDDQGRNALLWAVSSNSIPAILFSINGLRLNAKSVDKEEKNALHYATSNGALEAMLFCVTQLGLNAQSVTRRGQNALHFAAYSGIVEAMQLCINDFKINAESVDNLGRNALHYAVGGGGSLKAVQWCIDHLKLDAKSVDNEGRNALLHAAQGGSIKAVRWCIDHLKLDAKSVDNKGRNALLYAAVGGSIETMQLFITLGLKEKSVDNEGINVLHYAALRGLVVAIQFCIERLKLDVTSVSLSGSNLLHYAIYSNSVEAVQYVLCLNHKLNLQLEKKQDVEGHDALWYATSDNKTMCNTMKALLSAPIRSIQSSEIGIAFFANEKKEKGDIPDGPPIHITAAAAAAMASNKSLPGR